MSINREMDEEDVVHIYNGILLSHKKEQNWSFIEMLIDIESIIQTEVRKRETNIIY